MATSNPASEPTKSLKEWIGCVSVAFEPEFAWRYAAFDLVVSGEYE
jgi:hypothetical protein